MPTIDYGRFPRYSLRGFHKTRSKGIVVILGYFVKKVLLLYHNNFTRLITSVQICGLICFLSNHSIQKSENTLLFWNISQFMMNQICQ